MNPWRLYLEVFRLILLSLVVIGAAYHDLKSSRIPNTISLGGIVAGLLLCLASYGGHGLASSAWGLLAGGGPLFLVYLLGLTGGKPLMGAGDVKMMAAVGALTGPWGALWSLYYALWIAGLVAVCMVAYALARRRKIPQVLPFGACLSGGTAAALLLRADVFLKLLG